MKIDVHVHTKKTKKGDATTREVDARRFHEIISSTDVKIVAITNHSRDRGRSSHYKLLIYRMCDIRNICQEKLE